MDEWNHPTPVLHVVLDVWSMLFKRGLQFVQRCHIHNFVKTPFVHGQTKSPNTSPQAVELKPSCLGQAHTNKHGTGPGYKNTEPGCTVFLQYSTFHLWFVHSEAWMPSLAEFFKRFDAAGTNGRLDLSRSWQASEDPLKRP